MSTNAEANLPGYSVLCVPGTTENTRGPGVTGMLANITGKLPARFHCSMIPYPADYGIPISEAKSIQVGVDNAVNEIQAAPFPVVLLGYSQGAQIVRAILAEMNHGIHAQLRVVAAGLVADPLRPIDFASGSPELVDKLTGPGAGWGVAGQMEEWPKSIQVWSMARPEDIIPNAPGNSPVRALADWTRWMSITDPVAWGEELLHKAKHNRFQAVITNWRHPIGVLRQYADAIAGIEGYLTGIHTSYGSISMPGIPMTYCDWLAQQIDDHVR